MLLYVYDKTIKLIGVVERITSLVWTEKKYTYGTFEMLLPVTDENIELMQINKIVIRDDDPDKCAGEILYKGIKKSIDGSEVLEVTGRLLSHWLGDRLVLSSIVHNTYPHILMRSAVSANGINSTVLARNIPLLQLGEVSTQRVSKTLDYASELNITVLAMCEDIAVAADVGFSISVDTTTRRYNFNVFTGEDHTLISTSPCIFSIEYENILEQEYTQSIENLKNVAYVVGDENATVDMPVVVGTAVGFDRKEVLVKASGVKQDALTKQEYEAVLATNGEITLQQYSETLNFYNKINSTTSGFVYGKDYKLGDKVTCLNTKWKITIDAVITEAQTTYEDGQKTIYLTFGVALPTLFDKLKNLTKR